MGVNIALRRFLYNHGNIATEGSPKPGLYALLLSNDFNLDRENDTMYAQKDDYLDHDS